MKETGATSRPVPPNHAIYAVPRILQPPDSLGHTPRKLPRFRAISRIIAVCAKRGFGIIQQHPRVCQGCFENFSAVFRQFPRLFLRPLWASCQGGPPLPPAGPRNTVPGAPPALRTPAPCRSAPGAASRPPGTGGGCTPPLVPPPPPSIQPRTRGPAPWVGKEVAIRPSTGTPSHRWWDRPGPPPPPRGKTPRTCRPGRSKVTE